VVLLVLLNLVIYLAVLVVGLVLRRNLNRLVV
jgi:hypothetical protein